MAEQAAEQAEDGSAVVDFCLVSVLLTLLFLGLVQLGLGLHTRNVLAGIAADTARHLAAASAPHDPAGRSAEARSYAAAAVRTELSSSYAAALTVDAAEDDGGGVPMVRVELTAPVPLAGLWGIGGALHATGHAVDEAG